MNVYKLTWIIALLIHLVFHLKYKKVRIRKVFWTLITISSFLALTGYIIRNQPSLTYGNINASVFFYLPLFSLLYIGFFRMFFQEIYYEEPIMAKPYSIGLNQGEYRRLHAGDIIFTIFTLLAPILTVMIINNYFFT